MQKIRLAVSSCLLGNKVRHDGSHRHDHFLTDTLAQFCELVPVCPEMQAGLGIPREAMHLEKIESGDICLIQSHSGKNVTGKLLTQVQHQLKQFEKEPIFGHIFKKRSPSCGLSGIAVIDSESKKMSMMDGGLYAKAFQEHFPDCPVIDDGRLHNPELREAFFEKVFILQRWHSYFNEQGSMAELVSFHSWHKMTLMAHSSQGMRELGKIVANGSGHSFAQLKNLYFSKLLEVLSLKKTTKKNIDVMIHLFGHFKKQLTSDEKQEFLQTIEFYRNGDVPQIVPITLLKHYARRYDNQYVLAQHYLCPHPIELRLRNLI